MKPLLSTMPVLLLAVAAGTVLANDRRAPSNPYAMPTYPTYGTGSNTETNRVDGHIRRDGTYVAPHTRTNPNGRLEDNYSTKPNFNPNTGKYGTRTYEYGGSKPSRRK